MPHYRYKAVDTAGQAVTGTMDEASACAARSSRKAFRSARSRLSGQAVFPFRRAPRGRTSSFSIRNSSRSPGGLPLAPALEAIGKELRRGSLKTVVDDLQATLNSGSSLTEALERHRGAVPPVYIAAVRAGEETGNLPAILELCAGYTSQMVALKTRLREAMTYPVVVLIAMGMMLVYLLNYTIPQFGEVFDDFGARLPAITMFWIGISKFTRQKFGFVAMTLCGAIVLVVLAGRTRQGRYASHWLRLKLWGVGHAFNAASMARFCRSLGVLLSGRRRRFVELASATCGNAVLNRGAGPMESCAAVRASRWRSR